MNQYTVTGPSGLTLPANSVVKLSEKQLAVRRHQTAPLKGKRDLRVALEPLSFKRGEIVEIEGDLPKNLAALTDKPAPVAKPTLSRIQQDARDIAAARPPVVKT